MEYVLIWQSGISSQHRNISLSSNLILLIIILYSSSHQTLQIMQRSITNIHRLQNLPKILKDYLFIHHLQVRSIISYFFSIIRLLIMQHKQRNTSLVKTSRSANTVAIVGNRWGYIEENYMGEIRKIKTSTGHFSTDQNCFLKLFLIVTLDSRNSR